MFLAREGFKVDVYERRPEPKEDAVDAGRAYIIILIQRGQAALKEVHEGWFGGTRCAVAQPCTPTR